MRTKCAAKALTLRGGHGFFIFPLGSTAVVGGVGRVDTLDDSLGGLVSFFGFFTILLLR